MSVKSQIELVVFDLVGTTIYDGDAVNRTLRAALAASGLAVNRDEVNRVMGLPKPVAISALLNQVAVAAPARCVEEIHGQFITEIYSRYQTNEFLQEVPGTSAVFRRLRAAGLMVALNTGFDRKVTEVLLERMGWERNKLIDATITSDEVKHGRPFPDMIHRLMDRLDVYGARHVAKVGDTPSDIREGRNAGCGLVIGVTNGTHTRAELECCGPDFLINSVAELPALLGIDDLFEQTDE